MDPDLGLSIIYRRLDDCHDYTILDEYIESIRKSACEFPDPEFDKLLDYARKRRQDEFSRVCMAVIDVGVD